MATINWADLPVGEYVLEKMLDRRLIVVEDEVVGTKTLETVVEWVVLNIADRERRIIQTVEREIFMKKVSQPEN